MYKNSRNFGVLSLTFVCSNCGKEYEFKSLEFVRCLYCDSKVLFKKTPPVAKKVLTD